MGPLTLPHEGSVYIDTNVLIYSVERVEPYRMFIGPMWVQANAQGFGILSSKIIVLEALVKPLRDGNQALAQLLRSMFDVRELRLIAPARQHWEFAARLRAETGLKAADALHAATALLSDAAVFITNDGDFRRVNGLPVVVLSDLLEDGDDPSQGE